MSCVFAKSLDEHIDVQRWIESSSLLTRGSSSSLWSKTEIGDTGRASLKATSNESQNVQKIITLTPSKNGSHAVR